MDLARAYVQIIPTTKGMNKNITSELNGEMATAGQQGGLSWGKALTGVVGATMGTVTAVVGTATTAVMGLTKQAVEGYADYEQLVGGVETLFGDSASAVLANANEAFRTAGLSANDYMETVTGFSASLMQSLGGDTEKAVGVADMAIRDMADNANKMGTSMESIQYAYQGFAKQNYTMLDNLKLGYGGTKQEMERLLKDATALSGIEYDLESFSDIAEAIHVVQENLGITGTTAKEASTTITGSLASMQSAWSNVLVAMADDNADFGKAIDDLVSTIVGENGEGGVINNLIPRIEKTLTGVGDLITKLAPVIMQKVPELITTLVPTLLEAVKTMVQAIADNLPTIITAITDTLPDILDTIVDALIELLPVVVDCAFQIVYALADGIIEALPEITPSIVELVLKISDTIVNNLDTILECAFQIIGALIEGLINATPQLLEYGGQLIIDFAISMENQLFTTVESGQKIINSIVDGIKEKLPEIVETAKRVIPDFISQMATEYDQAMRAGVDIALNIIQGIKDQWEQWLGGSEVLNMVQKLIDKIRELFGNSLKTTDLLDGVSLDVFGGSNTSTTSKVGKYTSTPSPYVSSINIPTVNVPTVNVNLQGNTNKLFSANVTQGNITKKITGHSY